MTEVNSVSKKSNISIWKIKGDHRNFADSTNRQKIEKIARIYNRDEEEKADRASRTTEKLGKVSNDARLESFNVLIYKKKRKSMGLSLLLREYLNQSKRPFDNDSNDLLCFFYTDEIIFAITSGSAFNIVAPYADDEFPFHVAKKIFSGDFSQQEARKITGITYSEMSQYRGKGHRISRRESFGKIWKKLIGKIRPNVLEDFPDLADVIDIDKKNSAEIKSSIVFKKSLTVANLLNVLNALKSISQEELTDEERRDFAFLDTVKPVSDKIKKEKLTIKFVEELRVISEEEKWEEADNFDFCHPSEAFSFFSGENFIIQDLVVSESDEPRAREVLQFIRNNDILDISNSDNFKRDIEIKDLSFTDRSTEQLISAALIKYFHGELEYEGKTYFLIDGKWYEVHENFLENLKQDFIKEVFDDKPAIYTEEIPFINWASRENGNFYEEDFNTEQSKEEHFYHGDKIFVKAERGKIELFDLLYVKDDSLYIIQAKNGFGGSTRDACSQIQMAAETIEHDLSSGKVILNELYDKWAEDDENNLTKEAFLALFEKKRKYVLACSVPNFSKPVFDRGVALYSHIAKFEVLELSHYFSGNGWDFSIQNIQKS